MSQSALLDDAAPLPASRFDTVSEARLTWLRFKAHRLAMVGLVLTAAVYLVAIFAEPIAPFDPQKAIVDWCFCHHSPPIGSTTRRAAGHSVLTCSARVSGAIL
jgi:oligopeptide transport permease C-like protein